MKTQLFEISHLSVSSNEDRVLFSDLNISFSNERVALVGRNGVGKSTLLNIIAGNMTPEDGSVRLRVEPFFVEQMLEQQPGSPEIAETLEWFEDSLSGNFDLAHEFDAAGLRSLSELRAVGRLSHGELRKLKLLFGKLTVPDLLLLDEPTNDLDEQGLLWLKAWLGKRSGGLLVASHEPRLLEDFQHFFIVSESGCRYFAGDFSGLLDDLEHEQSAGQLRYVRNLNRLVEQESKTNHIKRRRKRKKRFGRISELGRATPKMTLNQKRDYAQVKHGRMKKVQDGRLADIRNWTKDSRRSIKVDLDLLLPVPALPADDKRVLVHLEDLSAVAGDRCLFENLNLSLRRERLGLIGRNGSGKTTLLDIMLDRRNSASGMAQRDLSRIGSISQGGADWEIDDSLLSFLSLHSDFNNPDELIQLLLSHKFPLALAERAMKSLSPGERVRAALLCLFHRAPAVELLVLDEPTFSLDLLGRRALTEALKAWPGGLIVASHDRDFLTKIGVERFLELG